MLLHFQSYGSGHPMIILHGLFGSLDNWHSVSRRLGQSFRVLAVDQRNHGQSPHSAEMNYPIMAEDISEFIRTEHLEKVSVLGHSMGGKTAMQLALLHPEQVDRLIVVDIAPHAYSARHVQIFEGALSLDLKAYQDRGSVERALDPYVPEKAVRQFLLKNLVRESGGGFRWKLNLRDIYRNYGHLSEAISGPRPFVGPTIFIRGGMSHYIRDEDWNSARALFPNAVLRTIPDAGHWVHAEAPEAFLETASEFLSV